MSDNPGNKNTNTDEIDLLDLFRRMGKTLSKWAGTLANAILFSIVFLLKRWIPLLVSFILAVVTAYFFKSASESFYTSDLVIRNNTVSNTDMMSYIGRLHNYCIEDNKAALAEALSIKPDLAHNIMDIGAYWLIEDRAKGVSGIVDYEMRSNTFDTMTIRLADRLDIRVKIKSPQELSVLEKGIISYIDKDSLFQQRNRVRLNQNLNLITRLDYDINQLDTLQKRLIFEDIKNRKPQNGGQMIFLQEPKTQLVYQDIQTLFASKQRLESERILYKDIVTVLTNFDVPVKPDNGTFYYVKRTIPLFIGFTLLLLIFLAARTKLSEVYRKY